MSKPGNVLPWSFSSLQGYEQCPRRFYLTRISKQVADPPGEAARWGNDVHKALELAVGGGYGLGQRFEQYQPVVDKLRAAPGRKHAEQKFGITNTYGPTDFFGKDVWYRGVIDLLILRNKTAVAIDYKGLALDTPLPTPAGWTTMRDVCVGDQLVGRDGRPCNVVGKSEVRHRRCYEVDFGGGRTVVADDEHKWLLADGRVVTTAWMADNVVRPNWLRVRQQLHVPVVVPWTLPEAPLPIDPYLLGAWLGDGKHTSGEIGKPDVEFWAILESRGHPCGPNTSSHGCRRSTVYGLRTNLRAAGLLGNKHIPPAYLRASHQQRVALLQGLMDTDGSVNPLRKQCVFSNTDERLVDAVVELLHTLGQRPHKMPIRATGFGKTVQAFHVTFRPLHGLNPFLLPRKRDRVGAWGGGRSETYLVQQVREVPSVPTQCVAVDSPDNTYLCGRHCTVTHNTGLKPKHDGDQLKLFAAATFALHPYVQTVHTQYLWLAADKATTKTFHRDEVPGIWEEFQPRVKRMMLAQEKDRWLPNPTGLCGWCPVGKEHCEYWQGRDGKKGKT